MEKPIDIDPEKADRLIQLVGKQFKDGGNFQNRYTAAAQKVKNALDQGVLERLSWLMPMLNGTVHPSIIKVVPGEDLGD